MAYSVVFALLTGIGMIGQWTILYRNKQIPELEHEPVRIWFHIAAEMATALALIVGAAGLLIDPGWGRPVYLVAMGMLFYTAMVSPGYFLQQGKWGWLGLFAAVIMGGLLGLFLLV